VTFTAQSAASTDESLKFTLKLELQPILMIETIIVAVLMIASGTWAWHDNIVTLAATQTALVDFPHAIALVFTVAKGT